MQTLGRRIGRKKEAASRQIEETGWHASRLCTQTDAATIATRMGRDPRLLQSASAWGSVARRLPPCDRAWPDRREGAAQLLRIAACNNKFRRRPLPGARFFPRSELPPHDGLRQEDASRVTHVVRHQSYPLGSTTVATRSICPSSRQGRLPLARKLEILIRLVRPRWPSIRTRCRRARWHEG